MSAVQTVLGGIALDSPIVDTSMIFKASQVATYKSNNLFFSLDDDYIDTLNKTFENEPIIEFEFALLADPQFGLKENNAGIDVEKKNFEEITNGIAKNNSNLAFGILLGDLAHHFICNPDPENRRALQLNAMLRECTKFTFPILTIAGNHDIGDSPTRKDLSSYENMFGKSYFAFVFNRCAFILTNSALYNSPESLPDETKKQNEWLEKVLKRANKLKCKKIFFFSHHPFFFDSYDEKNLEDSDQIYLEKLKISVRKNHFQIKREIRIPMLEMLNKYNVDFTFHGHTHWNSDKIAVGRLRQVITSSCGTAAGEDEPGHRIVSVKKDGTVDPKFFPISETRKKLSDIA